MINTFVIIGSMVAINLTWLALTKFDTELFALSSPLAALSTSIVIINIVLTAVSISPLAVLLFMIAVVFPMLLLYGHVGLQVAYQNF